MSQFDAPLSLANSNAREYGVLARDCDTIFFLFSARRSFFFCYSLDARFCLLQLHLNQYRRLINSPQQVVNSVSRSLWNSERRLCLAWWCSNNPILPEALAQILPFFLVILYQSASAKFALWFCFQVWCDFLKFNLAPVAFIVKNE